MIRRLNIKQPKPLRYFQSDFLERFTHIKLWHVWAVWGPITVITTFACFYQGGKAGIPILKLLLFAPLWYLSGIFSWTLIEYFLHRFIFHYEGESDLRHKIAWYSHGIHHAQAMLNTRLVVPVIASLSIGLILILPIWIVFGLIADAGWAGFAYYAGITSGYLIYDTLHWCVHFFDTDWKWYRNLRKNHMRHHRFPHKRFGVSNTLWDHVFRTHPAPEEEMPSSKKKTN